MAKPPLDAQARIWALPRTSRKRSRELLHMSLLGFDDLAHCPAEFVSDLRIILNAFDADAFHVVFDQIVERGGVTLRSSRPLPAVRALQRKLGEFLKSQGFYFFGDPPSPHVTINYQGDGQGDQRIEPISWRVDEILLIESIYGRTQHEPRGCMPLRGLLL